MTGRAALLSLALHGTALAAALWIGAAGTAPAPDRPMMAVALVMVETMVEAMVEAAPTPMPETAPEITSKPASEPEPVSEPAANAPPRIAAPPRRPEAPPMPAKPADVPDTAETAEIAALPPSEPDQASGTDGDGDGDPEARPPRYGLAGLANPAPAYPWLARRNGEEGRVVVRVTVDAAGRAAMTELARSSGHQRLDRAALEALERWRFAPAERGGRPVPGTVEVPVTFRLTAD